MGFIPVDNTASFELIYDVFGQKVENVFNVEKAVSWSAESLTTFAEVFKDWYFSEGKGLFHTSCSLAKIVAKDRASANGPAIEYTDGLPIAGINSGTPHLPLNVTSAVSFGTASRGRSYRGRIYQIALTGSAISGNQVTSGYRADLIDKYAGLIDAIHTAGGNLVVVSLYVNKGPRLEGIATEITSVNVEPNVDSQRRRLTGRGQ